MSAATHRVPRYDATRTAQDVAWLVSNKKWNATMADTCMDAVTRHNGDIMPAHQCPVCGAMLLENLTTGRYEMEHGYARHSGGVAQSMANAASLVEQQRAESLRRAQRDLDE